MVSNSQIIFVTSAILMGVPSAHAQEVPRKGSEVWEYLHSIPIDQRMAVLEREAAREGGFTLYGALGITTAQQVLDLFGAKYPNIKVDFVRVTAGDLPQKIMIESRTGRVSVSGVMIPGDNLDLVSDVLSPYEVTAWKDLDKRFRYGDYASGWAASIVWMTPTTMAWRTDRISAREAPKSLDDVLDPRWKGKVGMTSILERYIDVLEKTYGDKTMDVVKGLSGLEPRLYESAGALSQALAVGEVDLAINFNVDRAAELKKQGAPIEYTYSRPLHASTQALAITEDAPSPYSAALFAEFLTSVEGGEKFDAFEKVRLFGNQKGTYTNSIGSADVVPFPNLSPERFSELSKIAEDRFIRR